MIVLQIKLNFSINEFNQFKEIVSSLCKAYVEIDASLIEINPLVVTKEGKLILLDAKINIDDNALYRQADIEKLKDVSEENDLELEASEHDMAYIKLDGKIGCMVNGAGLAMATMDIIKLIWNGASQFFRFRWYSQIRKGQSKLLR